MTLSLPTVLLISFILLYIYGCRSSTGLAEWQTQWWNLQDPAARHLPFFPHILTRSQIKKHVSKSSKSSAVYSVKDIHKTFIHCVFDQIPNLQNCFTTPNKNLGGEGRQTDKHLPQSPITGQFFMKSRHFGLESISYLVHGWPPWARDR